MQVSCVCACVRACVRMALFCVCVCVCVCGVNVCVWCVCMRLCARVVEHACALWLCVPQLRHQHPPILYCLPKSTTVGFSYPSKTHLRRRALPWLGKHPRELVGPRPGAVSSCFRRRRRRRCGHPQHYHRRHHHPHRRHSLRSHPGSGRVVASTTTACQWRVVCQSASPRQSLRAPAAHA
jgi:hypothetical protein